MAAEAEKVGPSGVNQHAVAWHSRHAWNNYKKWQASVMPAWPDPMHTLFKRSCLLPRPTGLLPPSFGSDPGARQLSPDLGVSQSAFLAAGLKPLSARDEYLKSKALDSHRKSALKKWVSLVSCEFNAWGVAKQALGPFNPHFATGGLVESVQDCLADKATSTIHQRVGPIFRYVHFWKLHNAVCLPVTEHQLYDYFKANPDAAPTSFRSLLIALSFAKHLLGLSIQGDALSSGRIIGLANAHYSNRCAVKRRPPLTVQQVIRLEGLVNTTTAKDSDRIAAGAFLVMIYGRLRFSDMQRSSGFAIDSVVQEGVEVGYLEGRAERTKTSISLERKVRALPVAVPLKCVGPRPWVRAWMNLRVSQGLDDSFPVLPNPAAGGGWSKVPLKVDRGGAWLRALLPGSNEAASDVRIATHSCKATALSWLAKRGVAAGPRRTLGYHVPRKDKSLVIYARDSLAAPLRDLDRTIAEIATGAFKPDLTRSGMIANFANPGDPSGETEVDAISSSSSEASDDEEEAPQSEEEAALDHIAGQWGPEPGQGPWARHKQTRFLHKVRDESGTHLKCGRAISVRYEILGAAPQFLYPTCATCFPPP